MSRIRSRFVFALFVVLMATVSAASAATCTNATLKGVYGILASGLNGSLLPAASVSRLAADGAGNLTGYVMKSSDGEIFTYSSTGTYTINKNCTGIATWTNQQGQNEGANIYLNNGNKGAFVIQTDTNHVQTGVVIEQGTVTCTNAGVKHTYSMDLTGTVISVGQVAMAGQLIFNGTGSISGTATLSLYGVIYDNVSVKGTYTINSDCTGTAQITPQGLSAMNLGLLVLGTDKQMMAIEMDSNTIVAGMLQE